MARLLAVWLSAPALWLSVAAPAAAGADNPQQIVAQMRQAYAALQSYSDTGVLLIHMPGDTAPQEIPFQTAFDRPGKFRFAWTTSHPYRPLRHLETRHAIWSGAAGVYSWRQASGGEPTMKPIESLNLAMAAAAGVSGGASLTVAGLLMNDVGPSMADIDWRQLVGNETVDGVDCHHIAGRHARLGQYDAWIGRHDHLLRKLGFHVLGVPHEEFRRGIQLNASIPEQTFTAP